MDFLDFNRNKQGSLICGCPVYTKVLVKIQSFCEDIPAAKVENYGKQQI